jgi:hypothetical protein
MATARELLNFNFHNSTFVPFARNILTHETISKFHNNVRVVESVHEKYSEIKPVTNTVDSKRIYQLFMENAPKGIGALKNAFSAKRDLRKLASSFGFTEDNSIPICNSIHLKIGLELIGEKFSKQWIQPLFSTLLKQWLFIPKENKLLLSGFLKEKIWSYAGKNQIINNIRKNTEYFLRIDGPLVFSSHLLRNNKEIGQMAEFLNIKDSMLNFSYFAEVIEFYTKAALRTNQYKTHNIIPYILEFLVRFKGLDTPKKCFSEIIPSVKNNADDELRNRLKSKAMQLIGDPVLDYRWAPWTGANQTDIEAIISTRAILNEWINHEIVELFFNKLVIDSDRKKFWLQYYRKADKVKIFCNSAVYRRLMIDDRIRSYSARLGILENGGVDQSALVFLIRGYLLVEFSVKGTAFYAYKTSNTLCPNIENRKLFKYDLIKPDKMPTLLRRDGYYTYDMKKEGRFNHFGDWQPFLSKWISQYVGINQENYG